MVAEARSAPVGKPPLVARNDSVRSWIVPVAAAAEKVDVDLGHLTGDAGCEGLSAPRRDRDADTGGERTRRGNAAQLSECVGDVDYAAVARERSAGAAHRVRPVRGAYPLDGGRGNAAWPPVSA